MNLKQLRINWVYPCGGMSGGIKSNRLIAEAMVRRGHEVTIAYADVATRWPPPWRPRRMIRHATSEWFSWGKQRHHLEQSTARLLPVGHCPIQAGDVPDADVTIATWWETMEWIKDWPSEKGIKAYFVRGYELHGGDPERVRATYRMPAQKLVISTWLQRLMKDEYGDPNAVLVPNGLDWGVFGAPPRGKRSTPTVGLMYSANPIKGGEEAFWALHLVRRHIPELRIVVLTPHPLPRSFRRLANIDVLYRPDDAAIAAAYRKTDCWLLSSHTEGFGMPGLEAAACRCPVVATRCGGPADYVEEGRSGYLVDVGDVEAMAERMVRVLRLNDEAWCRMSEESYAIARGFDWDKSAEILERALFGAIANEERREDFDDALVRIAP